MELTFEPQPSEGELNWRPESKAAGLLPKTKTKQNKKNNPKNNKKKPNKQKPRG
jgi:hypothetical protein